MKMRSRNEVRKNIPASYGYKWHTQILFIVLFPCELRILWIPLLGSWLWKQCWGQRFSYNYSSGLIPTRNAEIGHTSSHIPLSRWFSMLTSISSTLNLPIVHHKLLTLSYIQIIAFKESVTSSVLSYGVLSNLWEAHLKSLQHGRVSHSFK